MKPENQHRTSTLVAVVFDLLNPIPFGFFVAGLIFDIIYTKSADLLWIKSAAWLICIGLFFGVVPRLINLVRVWFPRAKPSTARDRAAFCLYLLAVVAAMVNALVHSRDAYAAVPQGVWLSILTVGLLICSNVLVTLKQANDDNKVPA
ncbi:DUF2231 domain-containing protein [Acidovorax sp. A1169]|uniref:DUF2231 domain-containing protein n=1 Tax=Acidovorax sp. A1169 TaxID=3059524 RepID=UPI002737EEA7|nr:DUF2231 domain-containing protein [Acidovorax sp. A1169]MDP4078676.1 hypothetical protein [Acidovorax sp. A1169]